MIDWFLRKGLLKPSVDFHNHLLPGLDDGVKTIEEGIEILHFFQSKGFQQVITTPHVYAEVYPNTTADIQRQYLLMQEAMKDQGLTIKLGVAAEYFVDDHLLDLLDSNEKLLSFGGGYVLMETGFHARPMMFDEVVFKIKTAGYQPILAHPERYQYLAEDFSWLRRIRENGVHLQVNLLSFSGVYGPKPKQIAKKLWKLGMIDFVGSDIHRAVQLPLLQRAWEVRLPAGSIKNNSL